MRGVDDLTATRSEIQQCVSDRAAE